MSDQVLFCLIYVIKEASVCTARPVHSHLQSSFITSLREKYPRACSRSLTNLAELGLSLPENSSQSTR